MEREKPVTVEDSGNKFIQFATVKFLIGSIAIVSLMIFGKLEVQRLIDFAPLTRISKKLIVAFVISTLAIVIYRMLYRYLEKRRIAELSTKDLFRNLGLGLSIGFLLQSLTILVVYLFGDYTITKVNPYIYLLPN